MICTKCGKEIEDNVKFCGFCGTKINKEAVEQNDSKPDYSDEGQMQLVAIVGILAWALLVFVFARGALGL